MHFKLYFLARLTIQYKLILKVKVKVRVKVNFYRSTFVARED